MCTRLLWNDNPLAVLAGRTMDWPESTEPKLVAFPRGIARDGGLLAGHRVVEGQAVTWTSIYGSLVTTVYGVGAADGINERGLAAHMLFFTGFDSGPRDTAKLGLQMGLWAQYVLDNAATVAEALRLLDGVQPVVVETRGVRTTLHLAIEDAAGDSAIVEYVGGIAKVHHGREHRIMTNDPSYEEQLAIMAERDFSQPSSEMELPGNVNPRDRFARATYYLSLLPDPDTAREAVAGVLAVARNVSVPFGAPYKGFGIYNTEYRTVCDLTNLRYFFELTTSPSIVWVTLTNLDFTAGAPTTSIDPDDLDLNGDVTTQMSALAAPVY